MCDVRPKWVLKIWAKIKERRKMERDEDFEDPEVMLPTWHA